MPIDLIAQQEERKPIDLLAQQEVISNQEQPKQEVIRQYNPTFYEKYVYPTLIKIGIEKTPIERISKAKAIYDESRKKAALIANGDKDKEWEITKQLIPEIDKNWDKYVEEEYGLITPVEANKRAKQILFTAGLGGFLAEIPLSIAIPKIGIGLAKYGIAKATVGATAYPAIQYISNIIQKRPYHYQYISNPADLLPENATQASKDFVDITELLGLSAISTSAFRGKTQAIEDLMGEIIKEKALPKNIYISPDKLRSIYQTGEKISAEELEIFKQLGIEGEQLRTALKKGVNVKIIGKKVVGLVDKPYWTKIKDIFKVNPTQDVKPLGIEQKENISKLKAIVEETGAKWVGIQEFPGDKSLVLFNDYDGSTRALPIDQITKESISKIIGPKELEITEPKLSAKDTKLNEFNNFANKETGIFQINDKIKEVTGKRLSGSIPIEEANKELEMLRKQRINYAKDNNIAVIEKESGKSKIGIRKTGFYAKQDIVDADIADVYSAFQGPAGMALMQDKYERGGKFGVIYKEVWIPTKKAIAKSIEQKNNLTADFIKILEDNKFKITKDNGELLIDMLEKKVEIPIKHEKLVKDIRKFMDKTRDIVNDVRIKMGRPEIGYIENYAPHMQATSIWNDLIGNELTVSDNFDFIIPNQTRNPFSYKRLLKELATPEKNFFKLADRYISAMSKDMHITPAIENIKAYNMMLKERGLYKTAEYWDDYIRIGLLGKQHKLDKALRISPTVRKGLKMWKNMLNNAFLAGKVAWSMATQPMSYITLTPTDAGYKNSLKAILKMFNKGIRNEVNAQSLSLKIKSGDILSDAIGEGREYSNRIYRTNIDKWNDMLSIIGSVEEKLLHQASYIAGLDKAKEYGYEGEEAHMFADLVAERTQSMYNKENRALILSSDIATAAIPFQSFAVEMNNHAKEILTKTKGAERLKYRERIGKLLRLLIGIWLANRYHQALTGRENKTTVGAFLPFGGEYLDRAIAKISKDEYAPERNIVSFVQQTDDLIKASKDYIKYGSTTKLRKIAVTFAPSMFGIAGGSQLSNLVDGIIADIDEEVRNAKGKRLFKITELEDKIKAPIFGVWATEGGTEYWKKRSKK